MGIAIFVGLLFFVIGVVTLISSVVSILKTRRRIANSLSADENILSIESITKAGGAVTLTWRGLPGKTYRVQFKSSLDAGPWRDLAGDITASGATASKVDDTIGNAAQRFYRVVEAP